MKYLKILGLATVAAMALMAFIGVGSASATALCKTTPTTSGSNIGECPEAWTVDGFEASLSGSAILETTGGSTLDTCTKGSVSGAGGGTGSTTETVHGEITGLTWGTEKEPCSKTTDTIHNTSGPTFGTIEIHAIGDTHNGLLTVSKASVTVLTIFGTCVYGTGENKNLGEVVGGNPATIAINTIVNKQSGNATCPAEARWTANYTVTSGPLWIATGTEPN